MESKSFLNEIPIPIHVVFVDFDHTSIVIQHMLNSCGYQVTKFDNAEEALVLLRKDKHKCTIVITSDHLLGNISGFEMLNIVSSELQLPIIMVSFDKRTETKLKANLLGCCEYIVRPVRIDLLKNIWEHAIRHKKKLQDFEKNLQARLENINNNNNQDDGLDIPKDVAIINNNLGDPIRKGEEEDGKGLIKKRGIENISVFEEHLSNMYSVAKKPRLVWSVNLHEDFVTAINQIGYHNAVPKKILEVMKNMGYKSLSRENIASHLQKYRDYVDKENKKLQKAKDDQICSTSEIQNISPNLGLKDETNHFEATQELRMNSVENVGDLTWSTTIVMQPNINNVIEAQISPWAVNNQYSTENVINNNNSVVNELVKLEPQHVMSYQIDGNNCFDNFSCWQNLYPNNLSTDHGLTLDEEFENLERLFVSNVAHETSVQPHQDFGLI